MTYDRIIEKFGIYFDGIGLNKTCGRLFGIFMTASEPMSMGQLVDLLQISKSTASIEFRRLLSMGIIEKVLLSENRADFYQLRKNIWAVNLRQKIEDIKKLQSIVAEIPAHELEKLEHLQAMKEYCSFLAPELEALVTKYMDREISSGSYRTEDQKWVVEWSKFSALSDAFGDKMSALTELGINAFAPIEIEFLASNPKAVEEDAHLRVFSHLQGDKLYQAIRSKLERIFCMRPNMLSQEMREALSGVYYYVVTIREVNSHRIDGFVVFMGGGSLSKAEFKITVLAVEEKIRRKGVAGLLVHSLGKIGVPCTKLLVSTRPSNVSAIQAYKKWGFDEDLEAEKSTHTHFVSGHWVHLVRKETTCK